MCNCGKTHSDEYGVFHNGHGLLICTPQAGAHNVGDQPEAPSTTGVPSDDELRATGMDESTLRELIELGDVNAVVDMYGSQVSSMARELLEARAQLAEPFTLTEAQIDKMHRDFVTRLKASTTLDFEDAFADTVQSCFEETLSWLTITTPGRALTGTTEGN